MDIVYRISQFVFYRPGCLLKLQNGKTYKAIKTAEQGDFADIYADKLMLPCADLGARTPLAAAEFP